MARQIAEPALGKRRSGFYLLTAGMVLWLVAMISIDIGAARTEGYGLGLGDGGRVPPAVVAQAQVGPSAAAVVRATSENVGAVAPGDALWRILVSVAVLVGLVAFWFVIISRIGVF